MAIGHPPQREEKGPKTPQLPLEPKSNSLILQGVFFYIFLQFISNLFLVFKHYPSLFLSNPQIQIEFTILALTANHFVTPPTRHPKWMSSEGVTLRDCDSYSLTFSFSELTPAFICTNSVITKILFTYTLYIPQ